MSTTISFSPSSSGVPEARSPHGKVLREAGLLVTLGVFATIARGNGGNASIL
jgi:hypothetical protein